MAVFNTNVSLRKGSTGEKVKTLQTYLKQWGYYTRQVDGVYGTYTVAAVKAFQKAYGLVVDGWFGSKTCAKFNQVAETKAQTKATNTTPNITLDCTSINLKKGSKGETVKKVQTMLQKLGYYTGQIDGEYGTMTVNAVKSFQKATGHTQDGVLGSKTCPDLNKKYQSKVQATSTNSTSTSTVVPPYKKNVTYSLTVLPDYVVLPESMILEGDGSTTSSNSGASQTVKTGGTTSTASTFDCSKISLKSGSKGSDVTKLQQILKQKGYYTRQVDGSYGKYTVAAVKKLQKSLGCTQDGWFGTKTCQKLQQNTNTTNSNSTQSSNNNTGKNSSYTLTDFKGTPSISDDIEGISHELTVTTPYTTEKLHKIQRLQKTEYTIKYDTDTVYTHKGYINDIKITQEDNALLLELNIVGYNAFLETSITMEKTAKKSELLKELISMAGLKANIQLDGLSDTEFTIKTTADTPTASGDSGLTTLNGNDCTETLGISARSFDIDACHGGTKIGNSSANYAVDTQGMSAKEAILDIYNRFKYGVSLTSSAVYKNNRRCPRVMWQKTGKIYGNCADISRLIKCMGEVHGLKVGIRHAPSHYYNLIEVDGKTYRLDACFKRGTTGANYGGENCNTLTMRGGPWSN